MGWSEQTRQQDDRRVQRVVISEDGLRRWETMRAEYRTVVEELLAEFSPEAADRLTARLVDAQELIDRSAPLR